MYWVSTQHTPVATDELTNIEHTYGITLPPPYVAFLTRYGPGTYCGLLIIEMPDPQLLQSYTDYELWTHDDNCPITAQQLGECVVIGSSIDGDFLAIHPQVEGLMWLPRHSEIITTKTLDVQVPFTETLGHILQDEFGRMEPFPRYFEPVSPDKTATFLLFSPLDTAEAYNPANPSDQALNFAPASLQALAQRFKQHFNSNLWIENEHICMAFLQTLGGYVRFNYAYGREVAIIYESKAIALRDEILSFLQKEHCRVVE
ncbi:SMI1/KNR4 family protein [Paenibacillus polymyxa]|uniref:SMI1/KNR4 family protein n=1 Tax=Paenibacillus polymyxa TaxID=1406 RepID=A0AAP3ZX94_PAEPO|nr:SMI1/KNR4 family protein [Paenibacillus polymyxa]MDH2331402.1 SMI1/KNR4 family protein [Paenibacillus polymyxa]